MARPDQRSADADEWRRLYSLQAWRHPVRGLRAQQLRREPRCERCLARGILVPASVAHHRVAHLPDDARGCIEVIKRSMPPKVYAALDTFVLAAFAMAWAVHKRASHAIAAPEFEWIVVNGQGSQSPNPWLRTLNSQAAVMASLGDRLGLNPKARADLKLPAAKPRSKFDGLIGQNGSSPSLNA